MVNVTCVFENYPNYIAHILAVSRIVFTGSYSDKYAKTIRDQDQVWLRSNGHLLKWGGGTESPLSSSIVFIPGYLGLGDADDISEYFGVLEQCINDKSMQPLLSKYPRLHNLKDWVQGPLDDPHKLQCLTDNKDAISALRDIFISNYDTFVNMVLPVELPKINSHINEMNKILSESDYVAEWERLVGFQFKYPSYTIVLSTAMENGPNFNSLGYEKNWVYYRHPQLLGGIIHEIGTHMLIDTVKRYSAEHGFSEELYRSYETLCGYLTRKILDDKTKMHNRIEPTRIYDPSILSTIENLFSKEPGLSVESILAKTVELTLKNGKETA